RGHAVEASRPNTDVAGIMLFLQPWFNDSKPGRRKRDTMVGSVIPKIARQTGKKGSLLLVWRRQAGIEAEQIFQRIGFRCAVGVEHPDPVVVAIESELHAGSNGAAGAQILLVTNDGGVPDRGL